MRKICFLIIILICLCTSQCLAQIIEVVSSQEKVQQYQPIKLAIKLPYFSGNTNDVEKVTLEAKITAPKGEHLTAPAFCLWNKKGKRKSLWEVRFAPRTEGRYEYYIELKSKSLNTTTESYYFDVTKGAGDGFLRKAKNNPYYLAFDSGKTFFGIGHNVAWVTSGGIEAFDKYFLRLEENGCNLTRVWLCNWSLPIEWNAIGKYNQTSSSQLDKLLELAAKRNIYIILCLDTYGNLMDEKGPWDENKWSINPYNKRNGGPCKDPKDFFTDPKAKHWYKNKLRYIVSRWGHSPNILAFELWNEYNTPSQWTKEMAGYIKFIDPHRNLVTTSHGYPWGDIFDESEVWGLEEIDIISQHSYGDVRGSRLAPRIIQEAKGFSSMHKKPFVFSEVGMDASKNDMVYDANREGVALHNCLWIATLSKSFATGMNWWWDTYLNSGTKLYSHYKALANFLKGVDWNSKSVEYVKKSLVMLEKPKDEKPVYKDVVIRPVDKWGKIHINEFTILNNGDLAGGGMPSKYLHGAYHKKMKADHTFSVEYPTDGKFVIHIGLVSQGGYLNVFLDGEKIAEKIFPVGPGQGPWKRSLHLKKYKIYQCLYDEDFEVEVPKGEHTIRLSNTGKDWIGIKKVTFTNYMDDTRANARCLSLRVGDVMLFWVQNKASDWENAFHKIEPEPIENAYFEVFDLDNGAYKIEWWDTYTGTVISKKKIETEGKTLRIKIPNFSQDIACKVRKE